MYRGKIEAEKNPLRYALFVSFFPQLVAGPIERSTNLLPQLQQVHKINLWDIKRIQKGAIVMLYGYILKMIIAIGAARVMGFDLMNNFQMPFMATGIKDFWNRWHISLSGWFKDYPYFPLGGSCKGKVRKYINIFIVFLVSGLWHGASWQFVIWGAVHGVMRVVGEITEKMREKIYTKLKFQRDTLAVTLWKMTCICGFRTGFGGCGFYRQQPPVLQYKSGNFI